MTRVRIGHNTGAGTGRTTDETASEAGYRFQFRLTELILLRLRRFRTVTVRGMDDEVITYENFRRRGPDGGLDLIIEIEARTEGATKAVAARVRAILGEIR